MKCRHCNGTGEAPDKLVLECVGCQCKVTVTFNTTKELIELSAEVLCKDCRERDKP